MIIGYGGGDHVRHVILKPVKLVGDCTHVRRSSVSDDEINPKDGFVYDGRRVVTHYRQSLRDCLTVPIIKSSSEIIL